MKKTLIAMAVLAVSSASFAQVALTGLATFSWQKADNNSANKNNTGFAVSDLKLGVASTEDLGQGSTLTAKAEFDLGAARNTGATRDDYSLTYNSAIGTVMGYSLEAGNNAEVFSGAVSLSGGPDSTASAYKSLVAHANVKGAKYTTPEVVPGLKFSLGYSQYEVNAANVAPAITTAAGQALLGYQTSSSLGVSYAKGPFAVAYSRVFYNTGVNGAAFQDSVKDDIGGTYDFGVAKVGLGYLITSASSVATTQVTGATVASVAVPVGQLTLGLDYIIKSAATAADADVRWLAVGAKYNLSKTAFINVSAGGYSGNTAANVALGAADNSSAYRIMFGKSF